MKGRKDSGADIPARVNDILNIIAPYLFGDGPDGPAPLEGVPLMKRLGAIDKAIKAAGIPRQSWNLK